MASWSPDCKAAARTVGLNTKRTHDTLGLRATPELKGLKISVGNGPDADCPWNVAIGIKVLGTGRALVIDMLAGGEGCDCPGPFAGQDRQSAAAGNRTQSVTDCGAVGAAGLLNRQRPQKRRVIGIAGKRQ